MARTAIVLGAGGITGIAWLLGALEALEEVSGWDPGEADVISGTSAGAVAAAVRSAHVPTERLLAMAEDRATLDAAIARATGHAPGRRSLPLAWPGSLALGLTGLLATDPRRRLLSLTGFAPRGIKPGDEIRGLVDEATRDGWPSNPRLLVNACDYRSGDRVTFGAPGAPQAELADAVVASAAVPGFYRPVRIGDRDYVDGGLASFTNADVVAPTAPDLVFVLSPFSSATATDVLSPLRRATARQLRREAADLQQHGARMIILEPTREDLAVMGVSVMERARSRAVHETARRTAACRLERLLDGVDLPARRAPMRLAA